jgi:phenylalanyl-tRNA synthetase beta chain
MQISLKWINELVDIKTISLEDLIEKLTLGGFEVEEILKIVIDKENIIALDISTTANRSDNLSIQGISMEIAALLNKKLKISSFTEKTFDWKQNIQELSKNNLITKDCNGFIALTIENLTDLSSPKWLKQKLIASGIVPENNLLDFQNYILLERGYPIEFYDLEKISKTLGTSQFQLDLIFAKKNDEFIANNQIKYKLDESILVLKANELPISIAGIISHQNYECSQTTKSLLIEASVFNAAKIRQQSRVLGLRTNRSARYEKSINNTNLLDSVYRLVDLLRILNPNLICKLHTNNLPLKQKTRTINLNFNNIKTILGPINKDVLIGDQYISPKTITTLLKRLQFNVIYNEQKTNWTVTVPDFRNNDIEQEIDLIEEIGRLYGFNNFLTRLPSLQEIGTEDFTYQIRKKLTLCLISSGLNELIQYSLVPEITYLKNEIKLINPLVTDYSNLRISLLPNLLNAVEENIKKNNSILEGFEYGHVFSNSNSEIIQEQEYVAGIFGGSKVKSDWSSLPEFLTWFEGKAKLDELFQKLKLVTYWQSYKPLKEKNILHPYRTAEIYLSNHVKLGIFGQVHPLIAKKLNISPEIYLFELNFELIKKQIQKNKLPVYYEYSSYPKIIKDLSFIVSTDISFNELKKILYLNGSKFLTEINLLDEYRGTSIPSNHISLCLQFVFQSNNQTLKNKKIEMILENFKLLLINKFNAIIRT